MKSFFLFTFVCALPALADDSVIKSVNVSAEPSAWQVRRREARKILADGLSKPGDSKAHGDMDALLTDYETHILTRTPLENMDLIGEFYINKDGVETCLPVIVLNSVLGWYDALRFTSESGRAEILNNERLFGRAYFLGGETAKAAIAKLAKEHPDRLKDEVIQGIGFAEKFRKTNNYERRWPSAYGLERTINALGGESVAKLIPEADWDNAWGAAISRVKTYYDVQ